MRIGRWILGGLLLLWFSTAPAATRANASPAYADCLDAADPAGCLAREALESSRLRPREALDAVLRHGLVDYVPDHSAVMVRGLDSVEPQVLYSGMSSAMQQGGRKSLLASIALLAAARHGADPFTDPIYIELAHAANDDPQIPVLALAVWVKFVGMGGWSPDFRVTHAGLPAIWSRALSRRQQDAVLLAQIAGDMAFLNELMPQAREFLVWYARRPEELTLEQRIHMASQLAHYFALPEQAEALMWGIAYEPGWCFHCVRSEIAIARLTKGYDAASARHLTNTILELFGNAPPRIADFDEGKRDALEHAGAREELRELGAAYLRDAETRHDRPGESEMYAAASDYYMRAGDREVALELARRALPDMPVLVRRALGQVPGVDRNDPAAMANATQGRGTDAAIALYRAGAIGEALETHYLTGRERYINSERAGEKKDPQWIVDYHWQSDIDYMAGEVASSDDHELQQRAYDALVGSCGQPLPNCATQTLRNIAQVAAGMGDGTRMKEALTALVRQIDVKGQYANEWALNAAGSWAHCDELLRSQGQRKP